MYPSILNVDNMRQLPISTKLTIDKVQKEKKKLTCNICHKRFSRSDNLKTHQRIHTGEMPYSCRFCNKKFRWKSALSNHEDLHELKKIKGPITSNIRNLPVISSTTSTCSSITSTFQQLTQQKQSQTQSQQLSIHIPHQQQQQSSLPTISINTAQSSKDMISQILKDLNNNITPRPLINGLISSPISNKPFQSLVDIPNITNNLNTHEMNNNNNNNNIHNEFVKSDYLVSPTNCFFPTMNSSFEHLNNTPLSKPHSSIPLLNEDKNIFTTHSFNNNYAGQIQIDSNTNPMDSFDKGLPNILDVYGIQSK